MYFVYAILNSKGTNGRFYESEKNFRSLAKKSVNIYGESREPSRI